MNLKPLSFSLLLFSFGFNLLLFIGNSYAQAEGRDTLNVTLSVSGGASLGSYQAGINWVIINFFKQANSNPWFLQDFQVEPLPYYNLSGMAGSSAGNINSLLSSIEWFKDGLTPAEESTFWDSWINVGFEQLFPLGVDTRSPDMRGGIFHRKYFDDYISDVLFKHTQTNIRQTDDVMDIGTTLTRLDPVTLLLDGSEIKTQRFVTSYSVRSINISGRQVATFTHNDAILYNENSNERFGQLIFPELSNQVDSLKLRFKQALEISKASSAIPLFFEPVTLKYHHITESPDSLQEAHFVDGGIFDNRPLDLALKMHNARFGDSTNELDPRFRLLYLDVNNRRKFNPDLIITKELTGTRGLESVFRLMGGALTTARHYELEVLYRNFLSEVFDLVEATERYPDVVGDFYGAFGSFFGKPFRIYDFYSGIYDGFYYVADLLVDEMLGCQNNCEPFKGKVIEQLYYSMELSNDAKYVINKHYQREFDSPSLLYDKDEFRAKEIAPFIEAVYYAFDKYNEEILEFNSLDKNQKRRRKEPYLRNFIHHYKRYVFERAPGNSISIKQLLEENNSGDVSNYNIRYDRAPALLDRTFKEVVVDFGRFEARMFSRYFHQWWRVENGSFRLFGEKNSWEFVPELAQLVYLKSNPTDRIGFNPSPTIIPENHLKIFRYILPYRVSLNVNDPGFEAGYEVYLTRNRLHVPLEPLIRNLQISEALMFRASIAYDVNLSSKHRIGLMIGTQRKYSDPFSKINNFPINSGTLYFDFLNAIRLSAELTDGDLNGFGNNEPILGIKMGIVDFNGLLYWLGRVSSR